MSNQATIGSHTVDVGPKETLLHAALKSGLEFPNACRVGSCGSCKCRVLSGELRELTDTAYLLSQEEIDDGVVLACQSIPTSDVDIDVELTTGTAGVVVGQQRVTDDITRLTVQLDRPMAYRAGQFANVRIDGLDGISRCYSFATPADDDGKVEFFIKRARGGAFSTLINDEDVVGRAVQVEGPLGDFWLRPADAPLVLVAGGSGLAPIVALLQDAVDRGVERPTTLYFGARTRRDLYALDAVEAIADAWRGRFTFVPVLSDADDDDEWHGARGLVTDHVRAPAGAHAYLCGPPGMVDAAHAKLDTQGADKVYADRFTTRADAANEPWAGVWHYLKYFSFHIVGLTALVGLLAGGAWITATLAGTVALYVLGDAISGDDTSTPRFRYPTILTVQLWLALPLITGIVFVAVWSVSSVDVLGLSAFIEALTGYDVLSTHMATGFGHRLSGVVVTGLMIGMVATIPAHELTHRTWDPVSLFIGRCLLAFSFDTVFSIEHVYGHHRYVSTTEDPATAPRGRNVYTHILVSTVKGNISAWRIEKDRLRKRGHFVLSWRNAFLRGHLMSVGLLVVAACIGGSIAVGFFVLCALWSKALLEIVNYMEHYGMVRNPNLPVEPRHSWNTNRRLSSWSLFNLTRHSHHHAQAEVAYHDLKPYPDAPLMIGGYLTTILVAMVPPLWHHLMTPKLLAWDREYASPREQQLARMANGRSGIRQLVDTTAHRSTSSCHTDGARAGGTRGMQAG